MDTLKIVNEKAYNSALKKLTYCATTNTLPTKSFLAKIKSPGTHEIPGLLTMVRGTGLELTRRTPYLHIGTC